MPIPSIGALPAVPYAAPDSGTGNFFSALGQLPQAMQQGQLQRAQTQEQTATAQAQQDQADQLHLGFLSRAAQANPQVAQSPQFQQTVQSIYKRRGLPVPTTPEGGLDIAALNPQTPFTDASAQDRIKALSLTPQARKTLYPDAPQDFLNAKQQVEITPAIVDQTNKTMAGAVNMLGEGKIKPGEFAGIIKQNWDVLSATGDPSYYLSDAFQKDVLGQASTAKIAQLNALGVHYGNADQIREKDLERHMQEFQASFGLKREGLTRQEMRDQVLKQQGDMRNANMAARMQQSTQLLSKRGDLLDAQIKLATANTSRANTETLKAAHDETLKLYTSIVNQYNADARAIQGSGQAPSDESNLVPAMKALQEQINTIAPKLAAAQTPLNNALPTQATQIGNFSGATPVPGTEGLTGGIIAPQGYSFLRSAGGRSYYISPDGKTLWDNTGQTQSL